MASIKAFPRADIVGALDLSRTTEHVGLSRADEPERLARFLERNPGFSLIATTGGRILGACLCGHDGRRSYIHHLAVSSLHQQVGLGSRLVSLCLHTFRGEGIQKCQALVSGSNPYRDDFWRPAGRECCEELLVFS